MPILGPYGGSAASSTTPQVSGEFHLGPAPSMFGDIAIDATDEAAVAALSPAADYNAAVALRERTRQIGVMESWHWRTDAAVAVPINPLIEANIPIAAVNLPQAPWGTGTPWSLPAGTVISWEDLNQVEHTLPATSQESVLAHGAGVVTTTVVNARGSLTVPIADNQPLLLTFDPAVLENWLDAYNELGEGVILYYTSGGDNFLRYEVHLGNNEWSSLEIAQTSPGGLTQDQVNALISTARTAITTEITDAVALKQDTLPVLGNNEMWRYDGTAMEAVRRIENPDSFVHQFQFDVNVTINSLNTTYSNSRGLPNAMRTLRGEGTVNPHLTLMINATGQSSDSEIRVTLRNSADDTTLDSTTLDFGSALGTLTRRVHFDNVQDTYIIRITHVIGSTVINSIAGTVVVESLTFLTLDDTPEDFGVFPSGSPVVINNDGDGLAFTRQSSGFNSGGQVVTTHDYGWSLDDANADPKGAWLDEDGNIWVCNQGTTDSEVFIYTPNGTLLHILTVPDVVEISDVVCNNITMWVTDRDDGEVKAYSRPGVGGTAIGIAPSRDTANDVSTGFSNLSGITLTTDNIVTTDARSATSRAKRNFRSTLGDNSSYNLLSSPQAKGAFFFDGFIYNVVDNADASASLIRFVNIASLINQGVALTPLDEDGDGVSLTGIVRDAATWWGITADGEVLAWDTISGEYLIPGEPRPATTEAFGQVRYSTDDELDSGVPGRRDRAVSTANLDHWITERDATRNAAGFVTKAATDVNDLGTDDDDYMTADLVRQAVNEIHKQSWLSTNQYFLGESPASNAYFVGPANLGISGLDDTQRVCIAADGDDEFYLSFDDQLWTIDPFRGRALEQVDNSALPSNIGSMYIHEGRLYGVTYDDFRPFSHVIGGTTVSYGANDFTSTSSTTTGVARFTECPKIFRYRNLFYVLDTVNENFYTFNTHTFVATAMSGSASNFGLGLTHNIIDAMVLNDHVWVYDLATHEDWRRATNASFDITPNINSINIHRDSFVPATVDHLYSVASWRGQSYASVVDSNDDYRLIRFGA